MTHHIVAVHHSQGKAMSKMKNFNKIILVLLAHLLASLSLPRQVLISILLWPMLFYLAEGTGRCPMFFEDGAPEPHVFVTFLKFVKIPLRKS